MTNICCISVISGWQSAVEGQNVHYGFGPVFNNITDLWNWQKENLRKAD
jgi:hypothetical protein